MALTERERMGLPPTRELEEEEHNRLIDEENRQEISILRTKIRVLTVEKALNDVLKDLDGIINEAEEGHFSLDDLRDLRADLHGAMSGLTTWHGWPSKKEG